MTSNEARQQIEVCERQIVDAYNDLRVDARNVGSSAASSASSATMRKTLMPLILCIVGLFCFSNSWFLGVVLIVAGIFISYSLHGPARSAQKSIEDIQKKLNSIIDHNTNI